MTFWQALTQTVILPYWFLFLIIISIATFCWWMGCEIGIYLARHNPPRFPQQEEGDHEKRTRTAAETEEV